MKLTTSKMSRAALFRANSVFSRERRGDVGALVGGRLGARACRVGVGVGTGGNDTGSCKSGEGGESKDDFELHIAFFCCNTEH